MENTSVVTTNLIIIHESIDEFTFDEQLQLNNYNQFILNNENKHYKADSTDNYIIVGFLE